LEASTADKVVATTQPHVLQPQQVSYGVPSFARVLSQDPKWNQLRLRPFLVQHSDLQHHIRPLLARLVKACTAPCCTWILTRRGCTGWWSSPNLASILLASRDDTSALYSGGRTQSQGVTILSIGVAMVFSLGLASQRVLGTYL
jgi:hypothetical protein